MPFSLEPSVLSELLPIIDGEHWLLSYGNSFHWSEGVLENNNVYARSE